MPTRPQDYSVGWICAIPSELGIARELLDEEYGRDKAPRIDTERDDNVYTFGRIHEHNVVIACLPYGRYGVTSAAVVAKDMTRSFPAIQFGLMVGIAGGVPSQKHDIRLGDVVVSAPTPRHGGVLQYDFGKTMENGDFEITGYLSPPPTVLLNALTNIIARHRNDGHQIRQTIDGLLLKKKRLRAGYNCPEKASDRLYGASWFGQDRILVRQERSSDEDDPVVHYGLIASANQVMKDRKARDALAAKYGVLCFEMEAAGLMNDFPCLVIRGICDYCDVYKNDEWHGYAAATAAAYAKELLKTMSGVFNADPQEGIPRQVEDHKIEIADYMSQIPLPNTYKTVNQIDNSTLDVSKESLEWFNNSPEFRSWLSENESTYLWLYGASGTGKTVVATYTLWNSLKSRHNMRNTAIVSISCDWASTELGILWSFISQLSHRIKRAHMKIDIAVVPQFSENADVDYLSFKLWELLEAFAGLLPRGEAIYIIDGIDRVAQMERSRFLQSFNTLESRVQGEKIFRILITSKDYPDIRDALGHYSSIEKGKEWKECLKSFYFEEWDARRNKINNVQHGGSWLSSNADYDEWITSSSSDLLWLAGKPGSGKSTLTKLITRKLTSQLQASDDQDLSHLDGSRNQTFIVSSFYYSFRGGPTETSHELMLRSIAYQIFKQNDRLFALIQDRYRALKSSGLHWSFDDLKAALLSLHNVSFGTQIFIIVDGMDESDNARREDILEFLSSLSASSDHCIIKMLIASRPESNIRPWMNRARHVLLEEMNRGDIRAIVSSGMQKLGQLRQSTLDRQITNAELHEQRDAFAAAEAYIVQNSQGVFLWVVLILKELESIIRRGGYSLDDIDNSLRSLPTELGDSEGFYAHMLARLVKQTGGNTSLEARGRRIFIWTTFANGTLMMVELRDALAIPSELSQHFEHGTFDLARVRPNNVEHGLHSLCGGFVETSGGSVQLMHQTVREFLLRKDCLAKPYNMNEIVGDQEIAGTCCRSIYLAFVASITQNKADATFSLAEALEAHLSRWNILPYALGNLTKHLNHLSSSNSELLTDCERLMVQAMKQPGSYSSLLLYHWAKSQPWLQHYIPFVDESHAMACLTAVLIRASAIGQSNTVLILLSLGADPTSALNVAAYNGQDKIIEILVFRGAELYARGNEGDTALRIASAQGHEEVVRTLLDLGANVNMASEKYGTALQAASKQGHTDIVNVLIKAGADVRASGMPDDTALQAAAKQGHRDLIWILIDAGADVNSNGGGPLKAASKEGHEDAVRALVKAGAKVNAGKGLTGTALHKASAGGHFIVINILIDAGATSMHGAHHMASHWKWHQSKVILAWLSYLSKRVPMCTVTVGVMPSKQPRWEAMRMWSSY